MACPSTTKTTTTTTGSWKRKLPNLKSKLSPKEEALESTDLNILSIRALPIEKKRSQTPWHPRSVEKHISSYDMHISSLKYVYIYIFLHYKEQIIPKIWSYHQGTIGKTFGPSLVCGRKTWWLISTLELCEGHQLLRTAPWWAGRSGGWATEDVKSKMAKKSLDNILFFRPLACKRYMTWKLGLRISNHIIIICLCLWCLFLLKVYHKRSKKRFKKKFLTHPKGVKILRRTRNVAELQVILDPIFR